VHEKASKHTGAKVQSNRFHSLESNISLSYRILNLTDLIVDLEELIERRKIFRCTERNETEIILLYVRIITMSLTFHLFPDMTKCLFFLGFKMKFICKFKFLMLFFCLICPTVSQDTTHHHSVTSTKYKVSLVPSNPLCISKPLTTIQ
jgi:hypothetical protein